MRNSSITNADSHAQVTLQIKYYTCRLHIRLFAEKSNTKCSRIRHIHTPSKNAAVPICTEAHTCDLEGIAIYLQLRRRMHLVVSRIRY